MSLAFHLLLTALVCLQEATCTERPVIGIVTMEMNFSVTYIAASYVKAVEAAGARVVPIFLKQSVSQYKQLLQKVNGLLLPGGGAPLDTKGGYFETVARLFSIVKEMGRLGIHFPILGVCQGFEALAFVTNNMDKSTLTKCKGMEDIMLPLEFKKGFRQSNLYRGASTEIIVTLSTQNVTPNYHDWCITPATISQIKEPWKILSVNKDADGMEFISSMESGVIAGVQFHPEKCAYEWETNNPSYKKALLASRHFYDWLVTEARKNDNKFPSIQQENEMLIYNYCPHFSAKYKGYFEQQYIFGF